MEITERFPQSGDESRTSSSFRMIDVGEKLATRRRAVARGTIRLSRDSFLALREKKNPKGDVLALAEVAGIQAVKKVPESIPLCHSLPIEYARLRFQLSDEKFEVTVLCEVGTTGKTGVEMEALAGVSGALLSIYDLSKAVNPVLSISDIRLDLKEGGKSGRWTHPEFVETEERGKKWRSDLSKMSSSVLIVSDRCAQGVAKDTSGLKLEQYLQTQGSPVLRKVIVPDDVDRIRAEILEMCHSLRSRVVLVTGGTGMSPRDVTPDALKEMWTRKIPGIGELLRSSGSAFTRMSWISRSEAGLIGSSLVILLPGSQSAVEQAIETLDPILSHLLNVIQGEQGGHG